MYPGVTKKSDEDVYLWMLRRSRGGDVVVLTADPEDTPCDLYNDFILNNLTYGGSGAGKGVLRPRSVTTICFHDRNVSFEPETSRLLTSASAVFITGGDQVQHGQQDLSDGFMFSLFLFFITCIPILNFSVVVLKSLKFR
jgi:hypothetical protein